VRKSQLPTVTSDIPKDLRYFLDRVGEAIARNSRDRFVTAQELKNTGLVELDSDGNMSLPSDGETPVVFIPAAPTNLQALAGYEYVNLSCDRSTQYGIAFANVYRSADTDFVNAVPVTSTTAIVYSDYVGVDQTFYYWVSYTNILDQEGPTAGPVTAQTAIDITEVFEALTNAVLTTEMVDDLSTFLGNDVYISNAQDNYVVKIGSEGSAAGFGLATTPRYSGIEFDFAVLADNFFITPPVDFNQSSIPIATREGQVWRRKVIPDDTADVTGTAVDANDYFSFGDTATIQLNSTVVRTTVDVNRDVTYYISKSASASTIVDGEWETFNPAPFIVRTTDTVIANADGQPVNTPAGVYISSAFIQDGTITSAKIGTAAIDTASIADAAITNAKIDTLDAAKITTGVLESHNYTGTTAGWRLAKGLNVGGTAEDVEFILRSSTGVALSAINGSVFIEAANIGGVLQSNGFQNSLGYAGFQFDVDNDTVIFRATNDPTNEPAFEINALGAATINAANIRHTLQSVGYTSTTPGFQIDVDNGTFVFQKSNSEYIKYDGTDFIASGLEIRAPDGTVLIDAGGYAPEVGFKEGRGVNLVYNGDFNSGNSGWVNWDSNNYEDATFSSFFGTATAASSLTQGVRQVQDSYIKVVPGEELYLYCLAEGEAGWVAVEWFQDDGAGNLSYVGAQAFSQGGTNRSGAEDQAFDARKLLRCMQVSVPNEPTIDGTDVLVSEKLGVGDNVVVRLNSTDVASVNFTALASPAGPAHYVRVLFGTYSANVGTAIFYDVGLSRVPPVINASYAQTYIRDLSVDTLQIANNAVIVPETLQIGAASTYLTNAVKIVVGGSSLAVDFGTNIPDKVLINAQINLESSGTGTDWAAARGEVRYSTTAGGVGPSTGIDQASCQINARKGGPPTLNMSYSVDGWSGVRYLYLTIQVTGEGTSATGWWKVSAANISVFGAKK